MSYPNSADSYRFFQLQVVILCGMLSGAANSVWANSPPEVQVKDQSVSLGKSLEFVIVPRDEDGVVPNLFMSDGPNGAKLIDNGDGTRTFQWAPSKIGTYSAEFVVQDAQNNLVTNKEQSKIVVVEAGSNAQQLSEPVTEPTNIDSANSGNDGSSEFNSSIQIGVHSGDVRKVLVDIPVSSAQANAQQTSVDTEGGYVYTVNIEPGPDGDKVGDSLLTVLRQGRQRSDSTWDWQSIVVDHRTVHNRWHTAPAIAIDRAGFVHVAYNMHNIPWQYKRSASPHNIYDLEFRGQAISDEQLRLAWQQKQLKFPTLGSAEIPGNQITYPAFYKDNNRDLYVTYRFAAAPKRSFEDRMFSSGIAVYNKDIQSWSAIGGAIDHSDGDFDDSSESAGSSIAFAAKRGWTSYMPRLAFDSSNNMLVSSMWRQGIAGTTLRMPCVVRTNDRISATDLSGISTRLPLSPDHCGNIGFDDGKQFYNIGSFAISGDNTPYILVSPKSGDRVIRRFDTVSNSWIEEAAPYSATEIFFDNQDNLYAIASGIRIYKRSSPDSDWQTIYDEGFKNNCFPNVKKDDSGRIAIIHTLSCDSKRVTVYGVQLP